MRESIRTKRDLESTKIFRLTQKPTKNGFGAIRTPIPGSCEVYDVETQKTRIAVYIPGQPSIWLDEMEKENVPEKLWGRGQTIYFVSGQKIVSNRETLLLKYLETSGYNKANEESRMSQTTVLYSEFNPDEIAVRANLKESDRMDALFFVLKADIEEVRAYALALAPNLRAYQEIAAYGNDRIRQALRPVAEKNPSKFLKGMNEGSVKNKVHIIKAINSEKVYLDENEEVLSWKDGGIICEAPRGMKVVQYLADMALRDQEFKTMVKNIASAVTPEVVVESRKMSWEESLIDECIEKKVLIKASSAAWLYFRKGEDDQLKFNGKAKLIDALSEKGNEIGDLLREALSLETA